MILKVQLIGAAHIGLEARLVKSTCTILKVCFRQIIHLERDESLEINFATPRFKRLSKAEKFSNDTTLLHLKNL